MLKDTRDGDQAYWCHTCERGWRAGHLPPEARVARKVLSDEQEARRAKAKALLEESLEVIPEVVIPAPVVIVSVKKPRVAKVAPVILEPEIIVPKSKAKPVLLEPVVIPVKKPRVTKVAPVPVLVEPAVIPVKKPRASKITPVILEPEIIVPQRKAKPVPPVLLEPVVITIKKPRASKIAPIILEPKVIVPQRKAKSVALVLLEPETPVKTKSARVAKVTIPEPKILEAVTAKIKPARVSKPIVLEPAALIPEPVSKVSRRQPKVVTSEQKVIALEPMPEVPLVPRAKKPKLEPVAPILEPVVVLPTPRTKKQAQRLLQANSAQLDLFA
jgi:hypothetical protein